MADAIPTVTDDSVHGIVVAPLELSSSERASIDEGSSLDAAKGLLAEARSTLNAEIALAKVIGRVAGQSMQAMAIWGTIAGLFAFVGLLALAVGLVIALADIIGAIGAALAVGGGLILCGVIAGWRARASLKRLQNAAAMVVE